MGPFPRATAPFEVWTATRIWVINATRVTVRGQTLSAVTGCACSRARDQIRNDPRQTQGDYVNDKVAELKTDAGLLKSLREAGQRKPSAEEALEQRVSFVLGSLKSDSTITREQVRRQIKESAE